ncbi:MAG: aminopeptidase P family protein [Elusimicrobia bacterium]|nr:aminopeptidase P family protein [Elusimicrobiota bacterium]
MNPLKNWLYGRAKNRPLTAEDLEGMAKSQALAYACAKAIALEAKEGWTEAQAARLMDVYLSDHGVDAAFHKSFAWFGERSRFDGMKRWLDFLPSARPLRPGDSVILDTAPFHKGFPADIGYSYSFGENLGVEKARSFLKELRGEILELFSAAATRPGLSGGDICEAVARRITEKGYDPVHHRYPGGVLGHRLHPAKEGWRPPTLTPFGWQAVSGIVKGGYFPELMNEGHRGDLVGGWAIEPHLGGAGFGAKFEEMLVVDEKGARWLVEGPPW